MSKCKVGIIYGQELLRYSFPPPHPFNRSRALAFWKELSSSNLIDSENLRIYKPRMADDKEVMAFHTKEYIEYVKKASKLGYGTLNGGDTPAFSGVYEASLYTVGATLLGLELVMKNEVSHIFNPVGGLHHAAKDRAAGFCVFNDVAVAMAVAKEKYGIDKILYVDIDAHHGDGVFYEFYSDPYVYIADIHEDGHYLYPGTGYRHEVGEGEGKGKKLNIPLPPRADDGQFINAFDEIVEFAENIKPELIILQAGADGILGDPLTHLAYTPKAHSYATKKLHEISHKYSNGRIIATGGGGYNTTNVAKAWLEVIRSLASGLS